MPQIKKNYIIHDTVLNGIKTLTDNSIDSVITSPAYWQLRDYGFPEQWGLEKTYQEYLAHLWSLMDAIWPKLKDTGTVWINLGDTYMNKNRKTMSRSTDDIRIKSLCLIPQRFAIGCSDRGWIVRNDIIWAKPNCMPESVRDRFSKRHEYIFFMTKSEKYYFDLESIKDKNNIESIKRKCRGRRDKNKYASGTALPAGVHANTLSQRKPSSGYEDLDKKILVDKGKNPGDVSDFWDIALRPNFDDHYAAYNSQLINKPIIAGCPKDGIILDPFCGTGITLIRSIQLNRNGIGIDGSWKSCNIAEKGLNEELSRPRMF